MRVIVFFDLPTETQKNRKEYRRFRKFLINDGFIMMQESVYCKLALNSSIVNSVLNRLEQNKPSEGTVQVLKVTEKQFSQMLYLVGKKGTKVIDDESRLIIL